MTKEDRKKRKKERKKENDECWHPLLLLIQSQKEAGEKCHSSLSLFLFLPLVDIFSLSLTHTHTHTFFFSFPAETSIFSLFLSDVVVSSSSFRRRICRQSLLILRLVPLIATVATVVVVVVHLICTLHGHTFICVLPEIRPFSPHRICSGHFDADGSPFHFFFIFFSFFLSFPLTFIYISHFLLLLNKIIIISLHSSSTTLRRQQQVDLSRTTRASCPLKYALYKFQTKTNDDG